MKDGAPTADRSGSEADMTTGGAVGVLWTLTSVLVAGCCCFSMIQPAWIVHPATLNSLGLCSYCVRDLRMRDIARICGIYGGTFDLSNLPTNAWQAASVLYMSGCVLLVLGVILALSTLCLPSPSNRRMSMVTGYIQMMAVVLMVAALLVFPVGFGSMFVRHYCPGSRMYDAGTCSVGWSYILAIVGTSLGLFCPFLSHYTDVRLRNDEHL